MTKREYIEKLVLLKYDHRYGTDCFTDAENQLISDVIKLLEASPAFICDGYACAECSKGECKHTFDLTHAVNFKNVGGDFYEEQGEN